MSSLPGDPARRGALLGMLVGSVSRAVVEACVCPVLAVPEPAGEPPEGLAALAIA
jgi:nucleotide-binding universal stress UspA family protein